MGSEAHGQPHSLLTGTGERQRTLLRMRRAETPGRSRTQRVSHDVPSCSRVRWGYPPQSFRSPDYLILERG